MKRTKRECYIGEDGYCHVPLANGKGEAICDAEFIDEVNKYNWNIHSKGYACTHVEKRQIFLHRFVFVLKFNEIKNGFCLDHANRVKLDNRILNLRLVTNQQNSMNQERRTGNFKGVSFYKKTNKYVAKIYVNNKNVHLGSFDKEEDCAFTYDIAAYHYFKEFAVLNFPEKINEYKTLSPSKFLFKNSKASSKFAGVCFFKGARKFHAYVIVDSKKIHIGSFENEEQAAKVRDLFIIKNNLNRKLNFPKETYEQELSQESKQMIVFKTS